MKTLLSLVCGLLLCGNLAAEAAKSASDKKATANLPDPYAYTLKVYRFPSYEFIHGFVTRERGQLHAPPLPPPDATAEQIEKFLKLSHEVASQYLSSELGIPLLKGSLAAYDPASQTLAVRAPNSTQDIIATYSELLIHHVPQYPSFNVHLVEADAAVLRGMMKETITSAEHKALWSRMQGLIGDGKAKELGMMRLDARSGQRVKLERGEQRRYGQGFLMGENGWFEVPQAARIFGTTLEIDPVIGPDGRTVDLSFALEHDFAPPTERWAVATQGGPQRVESQVTDFHIGRATTTITLKAGMTHLLGVWKPEGAPEAERAGNLEAAFLTCDLVSLLPLANDRVAQLLKTHGEKVVPTPPPGTKPPSEALPSGMVVRRFRVPPDFLSASPEAALGGAAAAPPDPFAARAAPRGEAHAMRSVTAADVLKMAGITFPDGASANFSSATGELVVRNLPENQEQIEAYVGSLLKKVPMSIASAVHVVQADAKTLRDLAEQTRGLADHSAAWRVIEEAAAQGKAKILSSTWLETRSGQRASIRAGTEFTTISEFDVSRTKTAAPGDNKNAPANGNAKNAAANSESNGIGAAVETTPVGFNMEIDPVIGPDGQTLDLSIALSYDYAPPAPRMEAPAPAEKVLRTSAPSTDFHKANVSTALTLTSGMTRLLGIWRPEGSPEFQNGDVLQAAFLKSDIVPVEEVSAKK